MNHESLTKVALSLPGNFNKISPPPNLKFSGTEQAKLGFVLGDLLNVLFYVGGILVFGWLVWGVFAYILARGEKEDLAKARARIMWALIGFMFLIISFAISQYAQTIFPQVSQFNKVTPITQPCSLAQEKVCQEQKKTCLRGACI